MPLLLRQLLIWTAVCGVSAAPSFVIAASIFPGGQKILAMLAAIACFVVAYTLISCTSWARRLRRKPFVLTTLKIGYGTRTGLSLLTVCAVPTGGATIYPDFILGAISASFTVNLLGLTQDSVLMVFATTIVEGLLWNFVLLIYMWMVYGLQLASRTPPAPSGLCKQCGYDLRASIERCPECGTSIDGG